MVADLVPGHDIEEGDPHADEEPRTALSHPLDNCSQQAGAAAEVAAIQAGPPAGGEKLVEQIAMAGLDIDHVEADRLGIAGGGQIGIDELLHIGVVKHAIGVAWVDTMAGIKQWMVVGNPRLPPRRSRLGKPSRMGELQGDDEVACRAKPIAMGISDRLQERGKAIASAGGPTELVGIGSALGQHRHRLASPDQLGTALPKMPPAAQKRISRPAVSGGIPAFHRMDAPAVARRPLAE